MERLSRKRAIPRLGATALVIALIVAACTGAPPATQAPAPATDAPPTQAPATDVPTAAPPTEAPTQEPVGEQVILKFWIAGEIGSVSAISDLADEYSAMTPNVTIVTTFMGDELVKPALLPALNASTGPDMFQGGIGPGQPASIINAGHALDLTPYYFELGWDEIIPEGVVTRTSSNGKLWAIGESVQTTIMFYNKRIFDERNLAIPTTWSEFIALEDRLKEDFDTVVGLPAGDGWPISHNQTAFWGLYAGPDKVNDVLFGDGRWDDPAFVDATRALVAQNEAGYFGPNPLAIGYRDNLASFFRGEIPMVFTGTFFFPNWLPDLGDTINDFGVFAMPNPNDGQPIYPTESIAGAWYVNANTPHPDEAVAFLDWLNFSEHARETLLASGLIPVGPLSAEGLSKLPPIHQEVLRINEANRANGSVEAFFDTVMPANVSTVTYDGLQAMLVGQTSPEEFNAAIQQAWEEAKAAGEIMQPGGVNRP